jgi:TB2/DP1, HVA22 family
MGIILIFRVPFYYELKVVLVLWLLSPATKGSSFLYRKFVHPTLSEREKVSFQTVPLVTALLKLCCVGN